MGLLSDLLDAMNDGVLPKRSLADVSGNPLVDEILDKQIESFIEKVPAGEVINWMLRHAPPVKEDISRAERMETATCISIFDGDSTFGTRSIDCYDDQFPDGSWRKWAHKTTWGYTMSGNNLIGSWRWNATSSASSGTKSEYEEVARYTVSTCTTAVGTLVSRVLALITGYNRSSSSSTGLGYGSFGYFPQRVFNTLWTGGIAFDDRNSRIDLTGQCCKYRPFYVSSGVPVNYRSYLPVNCNDGSLALLEHKRFVETKRSASDQDGLLAYVLINGVKYYTLFTETDDRDVTRQLLRTLPILYDPIVASVKSTGEARTLFGDVLPPSWYRTV